MFDTGSIRHNTRSRWSRLGYVTFSLLICSGGLLISFALPASAAEPISSSRAAVVSNESSLASMVPGGAIASIEGQGWKDIFTRIENSAGWKGWLKLPAYQQWRQSADGRKAMGGWQIMESQLGLRGWEIPHTFLGQRWLAALYPPGKDGQPELVIVVEFPNESSATQISDRLDTLAGLAPDKLTVAPQEGTARLFTAADGPMLLMEDRLALFASEAPLFTELRKLATKDAVAGATSLAADPAWQRAVQAFPASELRVVLDHQRLKQLDASGFQFPKQLDNALVSLVAGGLFESMRLSPHSSLSANISETDVEVAWQLSAQPAQYDEAHRALLPPTPGQSVPQVSLSQQLGGFVIDRNWQEWYAQRAELLIAEVQPEFDKFETGLATLLSGKQFTADLLPIFGPRVELVSVPQTYQHLAGKPGIQLPSFALVLELTNAADGADVLQLVFQTITTVTNLEASKQGRSAWVMASESRKDVQIQFAKYLTPPSGDGLPLVTNFQPAAAQVGNRYILATSLEACRQIVDQLSTAGTSPRTGTVVANGTRDFELTLSPEVAATLLSANQDVLLAKGVQNGKTTEQSEAELSAALKVLQHLNPASLVSRWTEQGHSLTLKLGWK